MDRLTARTKDGIAYLSNVRDDEQTVTASKHTLECLMKSWEGLALYEDTNLTPEEVKELAEAKAEGRLVMLPCKVGDTVYMHAGSPFDETEPLTIHEDTFEWFMCSSWGNTVFPTYAEAEAALKENKLCGT